MTLSLLGLDQPVFDQLFLALSRQLYCQLLLGVGWSEYLWLLIECGKPAGHGVREDLWLP